MAELKTIITLRQGTTAEWATSTVVLKQGLSFVSLFCLFFN